MAREKQTYRSILDRLDEKYPNNEILTQAQVAEFVGRSRWYVRDNFKEAKNNSHKGGYNKTSIAKLLAR